MAPTLIPDSFSTTCSQCKSEFVFGVIDKSDRNPQVICSLCGNVTEFEQHPEANKIANVSGDVVRIIELNRSLAHGDLVAINAESGLQIKRVIGVGGDTIAHRDGHILVNNERAEDFLHNQIDAPVLPRFTVNNSCAVPARWQKTTHQNRTWFVYHHQSVHDHQLPMPVRDDYQYNVGIARQMNKVDRLGIRIKPNTPGNQVDIAFWNGSEVRIVTKTTDVDESGVNVNLHSVNSKSSTSGLPVSEIAPIAICLNQNDMSSICVEIYRPIEYRLRESDPKSSYPLRLADEEYFVLGDNVPVSVDSRTKGTVHIDQIVGLVEKLSKR